MHGVRMDEGNLETVEPASRNLVDQSCTCAGELAQNGLDIVGLESDVVHPRPAPRDEAADRSVLSCRLEELDPAVSDEQRRSLYSLDGERVSVLDPRTEQPLVRGDRFIEVPDRYTDVVDAAQIHAGDATRAPSDGC